MDIQALAAQYRDLKVEYDNASNQLKAVTTKWNDVETQLMEAMAEEGVNSIDVAGIGKLALVATNFMNVSADNKENFFKYLKFSGNGALIKEDVNPRTLGAFLKEHLAQLIKDRMDQGMDEIDARNDALEALKKWGAAYFTKRQIRFKAS